MERLGLSGDTILIEDDFVIKVCQTNQTRFLKSVAKQNSFHNEHIAAVPIIESGAADGMNYIKMPRLKCDNAIVWISKVGLDSIDTFIEKMIAYFASIIAASELKEFDYKLWHTKIDELKTKIDNEELLGILNHLKSIKFENEFCYGEHHGDLTLTNLFISNDNENISIDAIDFLDTFIESPIQDLVKIRQDTKHLWTVNLMRNFSRVDHNRVMILLGYIDSRIEMIIRQNSVLNEYYTPFQILNLLRIVPYTKDERLLNYLQHEIVSLL